MEKAIQLLKEATFEIERLRRQNEIMSARLEMFDAVNAILHTQIATKGYGTSPDIVKEINSFVESNPQ